MRPAKSPAQQNKDQPHAALLLDRGYKNHLELLRYTAPAGLVPHGLALVYGLGIPTRECLPLLYLPYYHKADVTSQTRALSRQNDVLHVAYQSTGRQSPKTIGPAPRGSNLQKIIIEDG